MTRNERGHLRYCERIGRHMTGDETTWDALVKTIAALDGPSASNINARYRVGDLLSAADEQT